MIHVADSPKIAFSTAFWGRFTPIRLNKSALRCGRDHPRSGIRGNLVGPQRPLGHCSPAPRHAPTPDQRVRSCARPSPAGLLPDTDTRIGKDRTRPDLHERVVYIQRADKELKAPPPLRGSAMVARPTRPQIFAVN